MQQQRSTPTADSTMPTDHAKPNAGSRTQNQADWENAYEGFEGKFYQEAESGTQVSLDW